MYGRLLGAAAHRSTELTEDIGHLLSAVTFLLFGAVLVGPSVSRLDAETAVFAVLSLTAVRMVPVAIAMIGTGARMSTVAFAGWFGPRGLATIVFALTVIDESALPGASRIIDVATVTVVFSVVAHGMTAAPLVSRYCGWLDTQGDRLVFEAVDVDMGSHTRAPRTHWWLGQVHATREG